MQVANQNPIVGDITNYGAMDEIISIDYYGNFRVVLFKEMIMSTLA